jgi:hypothetical protein
MIREDYGDYRFMVNPVTVEPGAAWVWRIYACSSGMSTALGYGRSEAEAKLAARNWITRQRARNKFRSEGRLKHDREKSAPDLLGLETVSQT